MAVSVFHCRKVLVGTGRAISVIFGIHVEQAVLPSRASFTSVHGQLFSYVRLEFPG